MPNLAKFILIAGILIATLALVLYFLAPNGLGQFESANIESIAISDSDKRIVINNRTIIEKVCNATKQSKKIVPHDVRLHNKVTYINFYSGKKSKEIELVHTLQEGTLVNVGRTYYKNDSLCFMIEGLLMNQ